MPDVRQPECSPVVSASPGSLRSAQASFPLSLPRLRHTLLGDQPARQLLRGPARAPAPVESVADTIKRAERDDPVAEYKLSHLYATGNGVEGNKRNAQRWLERAAEHGSTDAQYELGNALREGSGVVQDYEHAARWLELAAVNGHPDAQYALGQMYHAGVGVPADNAKAYMWFNLAAARDVPGASVQRDALLRSLTSAQVLEAQAEARRMSHVPAKPSSPVP